MQVSNVFNQGQVLWDDGGEDGVFEQPLVVHVDSGGVIVIDQGDQEIVFQPRMVETLCKSLREIAKAPKKK